MPGARAHATGVTRPEGAERPLFDQNQPQAPVVYASDAINLISIAVNAAEFPA